MAQTSSIEWTEATWNPIVGCSVVSPGCTNCYAMRLAARLERMLPHERRDDAVLPNHYAALTKPSKAGAVWTGRVTLAPDRILDKPLRTRRPTTWFVNSMSDLFHESVPDAWIDQVFATMALAPHHTFQVLTKRSARMRDYLSDVVAYRRVLDAARSLRDVRPHLGRVPISDPRMGAFWRHVWIGVSAEDQRRADERRDDLAALATAGWTTFVSYEPALGSVDWTGWGFLAWLISGGESGPGARPSHPDWHRAARDFCATQGIPYLFKQWGAWAVALDREKDDFDWRADYSGTLNDRRTDVAWLNLAGGCGFHGERFHVMRRLGKAAAGRLLDGVEHNAMPPVSWAPITAPTSSEAAEGAP